MPVNAEIPLSYQPPQLVNPAQLVSMRNAQQDEALKRQLLQAQIAALPQQQAFEQQQQRATLEELQARTQSYKTLAEERDQKRLEELQTKRVQFGRDSTAAAVDAYDRAITAGADPQTAKLRAVEVNSQKIDEAEASGNFTPDQIKQLRAKASEFNPDTARSSLVTADDWLKRQQNQQKAEVKPPPMRKIQRGTTEVDQEFDEKTRTWKDVGSGPKFKPDQPTAATGAAADEQLQNQIALARTGMPRTQVVAGFGKNSTAQWGAVESGAIKQIMAETGKTRQEAAQQFAEEQIGLKAEAKSIGSLTNMLGATRQAVGQLDFNINKVEDVLKRIPSTNLSPLLNALARGEEKWTGDPRYAQLYYYMNGVATESARLLSGGQASAAQLHEGARKEAEAWANANMTPKMFIEGTVPAMRAEGRKRIETYETAISEQKKGGAPKASEQPGTARISNDAEYNALPPGTLFIGPDGKTRRKP
jgi:hypothetical protein